MDQELKDQKDTEEEAAKSDKKSFVARLILAVLVLLIIGGTVYLIYNRKPANNTSNETADSIRNAFQTPPGNQNSNPSGAATFTPPNPTVATPTPPQISQPTNPQPSTRQNTAQPRGSSPSSGIAQSKPKPSTSVPRTTTPAVPVVYSDQTRNFQLRLPANWAIGSNPNPDVITVFNRQTGQMIGYVEIYNNSGETLGSLSEIFQGSPSVTNITQTSVNGIPALAFNSPSSGESGIALVYKNRIYYLRGGLAQPGNVGVFKLI